MHTRQFFYPYFLKKLIDNLLDRTFQQVDTKQILEKWNNLNIAIPCVLCVSENPIFFNNQTLGDIGKKSITDNHK